MKLKITILLSLLFVLISFLFYIDYGLQNRDLSECAKSQKILDNIRVNDHADFAAVFKSYFS